MIANGQVHGLHTCPVRIIAADCATAFGNTSETVAAMVQGRTALKPTEVLGPVDGGDRVPLALRDPMTLAAPPRWWQDLIGFLQPLAGAPWGTARHPVFLTGSNYCIDGMYALKRTGANAHTPWASMQGLVGEMCAALDWGSNVICFSHACVSAQLGLYQATQWLHAGNAHKALVVSFDFIGPFVSAGFHSLKILNAQMPAPYQMRDDSAIGLGDGMAYAILSKDGTGPVIRSQSLYNEMYHFTANQPDGSGFAIALDAIMAGQDTTALWVKGHGTGTLEAGQLEAEAVYARLPEAPLVSWKGALGHTLGSCALIELVIALAAARAGSIPGTVGSQPPCFTPNVATGPFSPHDTRGILLLCNAFGGAHGAMLVDYE